MRENQKHEPTCLAILRNEAGGFQKLWLLFIRKLQLVYGIGSPL